MGKVRPRAAAAMDEDAVHGARRLLFWKIA